MTRPSPLRDRKAQMLLALRKAAEMKPNGFRYGDVAAHLTDPDGLRQFMITRAKAGRVIIRARHGEYVAGPELELDEADSAGVGVRLALDAVLRAHGGVVEPTTALAALGRDESGSRFVRQVFHGSPAYEAGAPFAGYARCWRVREDVRLTIPLPGELLRFDVLMARAAMPTTRRPDTSLLEPLERLSRRIRSGLDDALDLAGMLPGDLADAAAVVDALEAALADSVVVWRRGPGGDATVATWWTQTLDSMEGDQEGAAAVALAQLVRGGEPDLTFATTVALWDALADVLGVDAAGLSRGAVTRQPRTSVAESGLV